ncbi:hypothetical protein M3Y99_01640400 [Aphelenchoides fujianensis]|nr:hypothetical protein M3Y99_01640400 [Aphelenchoides fujianensis]
MGGSTSKAQHKIATCPMPVFSIKALGHRHVLVAGGGGAAKTGVANQIRIYLLTYDAPAEQQPQPNVAAAADGLPPLVGVPVSKADTATAAVMNADVLQLDGEEKFLIATGEDDYCALYTTSNYSVETPLPDGDEKDVRVDERPRLALNLRPQSRFRTDESKDDPYQKCVRFDHSKGHAARLATGGSDGHLRVWDISDAVKGRLRSSGDHKREPVQEFQLNGGCVDDVDFSADGTTLAAVTDKWVGLISLPNNGARHPLPTPGQIPSEKYKVRSIRFTNLSTRVTVFAVAYQPRVRTGKQSSYVALWTFNGERFNLANARAIKNERVSCIAVSPERSEFVACGTLEGNVFCFETGNLECVYQSPNTNSSFITSVDFLPDRQTVQHPRQPPRLLPGAGADAMATIVALSNRTVQLHSVPFPAGTSLTRTLVSLGFQLLVVYLLAYVLFLY